MTEINPRARRPSDFVVSNVGRGTVSISHLNGAQESVAGRPFQDDELLERNSSRSPVRQVSYGHKLNIRNVTAVVLAAATIASVLGYVLGTYLQSIDTKKNFAISNELRAKVEVLARQNTRLLELEKVFVQECNEDFSPHSYCKNYRNAQGKSPRYIVTPSGAL